MDERSARLLTTGIDGTARLWDLRTGAELHVLHNASMNVVYDGEFSPDGTVIVTVGDDAIVRFWDPETGREIGRLHGHQDMIVIARFADHGSYLVTAGVDRKVVVWRMPTPASDEQLASTP